MLGPAGSDVQDSIPNLQRPADRNAAATVTVNRAVRDNTTAIEARHRTEESIVAAKSAVSDMTLPEMPPPWPHGWPSCPPSALLPLTVLLVIVNVPALSIPPPD